MYVCTCSNNLITLYTNLIADCETRLTQAQSNADRIHILEEKEEMQKLVISYYEIKIDLEKSEKNKIERKLESLSPGKYLYLSGLEYLLINN